MADLKDVRTDSLDEFVWELSGAFDGRDCVSCVSMSELYKWTPYMMLDALAIVEIAGIRGSSSSLQSRSSLELDILVNICWSGRKQGSSLTETADTRQSLLLFLCCW